MKVEYTIYRMFYFIVLITSILKLFHKNSYVTR